MTLRRGTWGVFQNGIVTGFAKESIDVRDAASAAGTTDGSLTVENTYLDILPRGPDQGVFLFSRSDTQVVVYIDVRRLCGNDRYRALKLP
jgi:hypothetical protein